MPTEKEVYQFHADQYERLIVSEDYQRNLPSQIAQVCDPTGLQIIELGAGTGRLTRDLVKQANHVYATDASFHMLAKASEVPSNKDAGNLLIAVSDMRNSPFPNSSADLVIAGWSFCYLAVWGGDKWQQEVDRGFDEAMRLLKPGGTIILIESFGTGAEDPNPPPHLANYLAYLTNKGFQSNWFRTDYRFSSVEEADEISSFFFGEEMSQKIRQNLWTILPECTAIFWLKK
ncbi:MAG: methyltransferase domain-containing protein [Chloroflexi bacterium]|nr:methyltransferase domain-containing protein [Chloroflexota bacterium]